MCSFLVDITHILDVTKYLKQGGKNYISHVWYWLQVATYPEYMSYYWLVVLEHFLFFHIFGIIIPTVSYYTEGFKPPTRLGWCCTLGLMIGIELISPTYRIRCIIIYPALTGWLNTLKSGSVDLGPIEHPIILNSRMVRVVSSTNSTIGLQTWKQTFKLAWKKG
jgi:hypothetical protein